MADSPRLSALPSASDSEPYVPLSWVSVAAFAAALLFVLLMIGLAWDSFQKKRPLLEPELVVIFVAIVMTLSFVGRRAVRNAEGTTSGRAWGVDLNASAWWTAIVLGAGYAAYWFAITLPLQNEAQANVQKWIGSLDQGDFGSAFHQTLPPNSGVAAGDVATMEARYRPSFVQLRQSKLVRTALRNRGECRYEPGSIRDLSYETGQLTCTAGGTLVCPEGRFTLAVPLRATVAQISNDREKVSAGRQWQIQPDAEGYITLSELTPYGWAVNEVIGKAGEVGRAFLSQQAFSVGARREAFVTYSEGKDFAGDTDLSPLAAVGGWGVIGDYPPVWLDRTSDRLFTLPGGAAPSAEQLERVRRMWRTGGVLPPGTRIKDLKDFGENLVVRENGLELHIPIELPLPGRGGEPGAAMGRLVLGCSEAALLARLKELQSGPAATIEQPPDSKLPASTWRVLRIESNFQFHSPPPPQKGPRGS